MIRTQIYLTQQQYHSISQLAVTEKKPAAQILRELLDVGLKNKKKVTAKDALMELVQIGKKSKLSGPTDLSTTIDKLLYED